MGVGYRGGVIREMSLSRLNFYFVFPSLCRKLNHAPQRQRAERKEAWAPILAHLLIRCGWCIPLYFLFLAVKRELAPLTSCHLAPAPPNSSPVPCVCGFSLCPGFPCTFKKGSSLSCGVGGGERGEQETSLKSRFPSGCGPIFLEKTRD